MAVITNIRKNIMGTTDFDGRFPGMAKPQDFIVYPVKDASTQITIQSDNRFGYINMETGDVQVAKGTGTYANSATFMLAKMRGTVVKDKLTPEQLAELRQHIGRTAGAEVGSAGVYSDNTGALGIGGLRGPGAPAAESRVRAFVHRLLEDDQPRQFPRRGAPEPGQPRGDESGLLEPVKLSRIRLGGHFFNLEDWARDEIEWTKVSATTGKPVDPQAKSPRIMNPEGSGQFDREGNFDRHEYVRPASQADLQ